MDLELERQKLRRAAIRSVLYSVYPSPMGEGLIFSSIGRDLTPTHHNLREALIYLRDRKQVNITRRGGISIVGLSADGLDRVESSEDFNPARARQSRMLRLRVLQALSWGGSELMGNALIRAALREDTDLDLSDPALERSLAYLEARGLCAREENLSRILPDGTDYLAGEGADITGVTRPTDWS
ncbi:hypothetical protein CCP3SC15_330007 [Gammaproteobacteria bacterium]